MKSPVSARINSCAGGSDWKIHAHCRILQVIIIVIFFFWGGGGAKWRRYTHTVRHSRWKTSHFDDHIIFLHSGAMWALGLVVLLVTVAGVLAVLVYVLKWWHPRWFLDAIEWLRVSDLDITIASPSFASLFYMQIYSRPPRLTAQLPTWGSLGAIKTDQGRSFGQTF